MTRFEEWQKEYRNKKIIDFYSDLTQDDIEVLNKLGIEVKKELYTEYEYEMLKCDVGAYYKDDDYGPEDLEYVKPLENTGISFKRYQELLDKMDKLEEKYCKLYSKVMLNE